MKYIVKRACGHEEEVQIYGSAADRERKLKWYEETECKECWKLSQVSDCEEVRMSYRDYKTQYADCKTKTGSYDAAEKTIVVYVPREEPVAELSEAEEEEPITEEEAINIMVACGMPEEIAKWWLSMDRETMQRNFEHKQHLLKKYMKTERGKRLADAIAGFKTLEECLEIAVSVKR